MVAFLLSQFYKVMQKNEHIFYEQIYLRTKRTGINNQYLMDEKTTKDTKHKIIIPSNKY